MTDISLSYPKIGPREMNDTPSPSGSLSITWQKPEGLLGFSLVAWVLKILTLGIYGFWAKTEVRRRIWTAIRMDGEPLRYTGTGGELFKGFLIVLIGVLLPLILTYAVLIVSVPRESPLLVVVGAGFYAIFFFLIGLATYRATRYRLSRTLWRGIRAGLDGAPLTYAVTWFWTALLIPLTFGWIMPWRATKLHAFMTNNIRFGQTPVSFDASSKPLYLRFAGVWAASAAIIAVVASIAWTAIMSDSGFVFHEEGTPIRLSPETSQTIGFSIIAAYLLFGIVMAWYQAFKMRHFASHTHFAGATFKSTVTTPGLIWLVVSNMLLATLSLGILLPITQARSARYFITNLSLDGTVDMASVLQGAEQTSSMGEGLAQAFDLDAF